MCKVCTAVSEPFGKGVILGKHEIQYFRCHSCGLIETEDPYWLTEAYKQPIAPGDIGLLKRNIETARMTQVFMRLFSDPSGRCVDYGGGYGILTRLMRDAGYDFRRWDKHCPNLFATGFDLPQDNQGFSVLTAFEVFEHLVDPVAEMTEMLRLSRTILFTTELVPDGRAPLPGSWWYYGLDAGQHITLYTTRSLELLAAKFGLRYYSAAGLHVFTDQKLSPFLFRVAMNLALRCPIPFCGRRRSLLDADYEKVTGMRCDKPRCEVVDVV
jgi:hypothetical protein